MTAEQALSALWHDIGLPADALDDAKLSGADPCLPSSFAVGTAAVASIAAAGLAAAALWRLRTGRRQTVAVDMRHACAEFRSEQYLRINGKPAYTEGDGIAGLYPTRDSWVRLHTNFPHHREGVLRLLRCEANRAAVSAALLGWDAVAFEDAAAEAGLAVTALRSFAEWDQHPQGQAVPTLPLVSIQRIGSASPEPLTLRLPHASRPLGGLKVLDLTRVIAGPVCGRTLAAHGAEVMNVTGPGLPSYRVEDLGRGKLATQIDLRDPRARGALLGLAEEADVFVQGYRPGAIAGRGFTPQKLADQRPGIVVASLSAYGAAGPWAERRGFDSLVQTASGFNVAEAEAAGQTKPRPLPMQALDHASGYLLAFGIMAALHRRVTEGGSWHVQVSLARTGHWIRSLGRIENGFSVPDQTADDIPDLFETTPSGFGEMTAIRHAAQMSETPAHWDLPSVPLGSHMPRWQTASDRRFTRDRIGTE